MQDPTTDTSSGPELEPVFMWNEFDPKKIVWGPIKKGKVSMCFPKYDYHKDKEPAKILVQFPEFDGPFGLNSYRDEKTGVTTYSMTQTVDGPEAEEFTSWYRDLDRHVVSEALGPKRSEWFPKYKRGPEDGKKIEESFDSKLSRGTSDYPLSQFKAKVGMDSTGQFDCAGWLIDKENNEFKAVSQEFFAKVFRPNSVFFNVYQLTCVYLPGGEKKGWGLAWKAHTIARVKADKPIGSGPRSHRVRTDRPAMRLPPGMSFNTAPSDFSELKDVEEEE